MPSRLLWVALLACTILADGLWTRADEKLAPGVMVEIMPPRHRGYAPITALAVSPDGQFLVSVGGNHGHKVWPLKQGAELPQETMISGMNKVAQSTDGKLLASGEDDRLVHVMERKSGLEVCRCVGHGGLITAVAFGPDAATVISASLDKSVRVWDAKTGKELRKVEGHRDQVNAIRLSPDGKTLATASMDHTVRFWDAEGKELRRLEGHEMGVVSLDFSRDGKRLVSGSLDGTTRIWDTATGQELLKLSACERGVGAVVFLPDGKSVIVGDGEGFLRRWDATTGEAKDYLTRPPRERALEPIGALAWSPDGARVVTGSEEGVRIWDAKTGKLIRLLGRHTDTIWSLAWSPDGKQVSSAGRRDGTVHVWDAESGKELFLFGHAHQGGVTRLAYSPDGTKLASGGGSYDPSIYIWDTKTGKVIQSLKASMQFLEGVAWSPDSRRLASASQDGLVRVWDPASGKELRKLIGPPQTFRDLAWSPDGKWLATAGSQGIGCLWDPEGVREPRPLGVGRYGNGRSISFSPDGRTLATGPAGGPWPAVLWEVATGLERAQFPRDHGGDTLVAFAADGRSLASAGDVGKAYIWDVTGLTGQPKPNLNAKSLEGLWKALSADAATAYSASWTLALAPARSVPFLDEHLKPAAANDLSQVPSWIADLDDEAFSVRERASRELEKLGDLIEDKLRAARKATASLEVRLRLDALLSKSNGPSYSPDRLQQLRALEVLEAVSSPEARQVVVKLTEGAPECWLTREANATLARMKP